MTSLSDEELRVHADALLESGDPEGELIQVALALKDAPIDDDARIDLLVRQAQLENALAPRLTVDDSLARRVDFYRKRGVVDSIVVSDPEWSQCEELAEALRARAPLATRLDVRSDGENRPEHLLAALPSITALTQWPSSQAQIDDLGALLASSIATRLEGLNLALLGDLEADPAAGRAIARALFDGQLERLERLSLDDLGAYDAEKATSNLPSLKQLDLSVDTLDTAVLARLLIRSHRLDELRLRANRPDPEVPAIIARQPLRLRALRLAAGTFTIDNISTLLEWPLRGTIEQLALSGPVVGDAPLAPIVTPSLRNLTLQKMDGAALAHIVRALSAPSLRHLWLEGQPLAALDAPLVAQAERLGLLSNGPHAPAHGGPRRAARAHDLMFALSTAELENVLAALDLSRVRSVSNAYIGDSVLDEGSLPLLFGAMPELVEASFAYTPRTLHELVGTTAPPQLAALQLHGPPTDAVIDALAAWSGAPQLRMLRLPPSYLSDETDEPYTAAAIARLADRALFPRLELLAIELSDELRDEVAPILDERFGPHGWSHRP